MKTRQVKAIFDLVSVPEFGPHRLKEIFVLSQSCDFRQCAELFHAATMSALRSLGRLSGAASNLFSCSAFARAIQAPQFGVAVSGHSHHLIRYESDAE